MSDSNKMVDFALDLPEIVKMAKIIWPDKNTHQMEGKYYDEWQYQLMNMVIADDPLEYYQKRLDGRTYNADKRAQL